MRSRPFCEPMEYTTLLIQKRLVPPDGGYAVLDASGETLCIAFQRDAFRRGVSRRGQPRSVSLLDVSGRELGEARERLFSFPPAFELFPDGVYAGTVSRTWSDFRPLYRVRGPGRTGWRVRSEFPDWEFDLLDRGGRTAAVASFDPLRRTRGFTLRVAGRENLPYILLLALSMDSLAMDALC